MTQKQITVVGCGHWGKNLVRNFHELGALHSICDNTAETAAQMSETYNVPAISWDEALADKDVQGIVIASPAPFHFDMAKAALEAGKDVYEKKSMLKHYVLLHSNTIVF